MPPTPPVQMPPCPQRRWHRGRSTRRLWTRSLPSQDCGGQMLQRRSYDLSCESPLRDSREPSHQWQVREGRPYTMHLKGVAKWQDDARAFSHSLRVDDYQLAAHVLQVMSGAQEVTLPFFRTWRARHESRLMANVSGAGKIGLNRPIDHVEPAE